MDGRNDDQSRFIYLSAPRSSIVWRLGRKQKAAPMVLVNDFKFGSTISFFPPFLPGMGIWKSEAPLLTSRFPWIGSCAVLPVKTGLKSFRLIHFVSFRYCLSMLAQMNIPIR